MKRVKIAEVNVEDNGDGDGDVGQEAVEGDVRQEAVEVEGGQEGAEGEGGTIEGDGDGDGGGGGGGGDPGDDAPPNIVPQVQSFFYISTFN